MKEPYNVGTVWANSTEILSKHVVCVALIVLCGTAISCRKAATATADHVGTRPATEAITEADGLYAQRTDVVKVRQAIVAVRQAQADDSTNYELAWRLAKYNYYLGSHTTESTEKSKAFHDGVEAGKLAVQLRNDKPEGHFWLGANYGGNAQLSALAGFSEIEDIKTEMETVLKIDEKYQSGSAYMVLGQLYLEAPRILGGDVSKAINYLEKGIKIGPDNDLMRAKLAAAYAAAHRNEDARKQIETLIATKPSPEYQPEY
ncbi:MAG TPA: TRAP transporter TatT component family protein, partial [Pyrinomonadaceae bacterium]|nr:TRAP transporter TatT component family protein [Pyrinomonadaceae bacterium]